MAGNIIVTGGAGYIGSFMVRRLKEDGFEPIIVDDLSSGHQELVSDFRLEKINILTEKEKLDNLLMTEKIEGVIHMASFIQMGESFVNPEKYYYNNVVGFLNLLSSMKKGNVNKIIMSSSAGIFGNPVRVPIEENDPKNPLNAYGETKYMMERILEDYDSAYGLKFASIRYFNAAGASIDGSLGEAHPQESHLIPNIINSVLNNSEFTLFGNDYDTADGTCVRDYIHVLDLAEIHSKLMSNLIAGANSNFYNAGIGRGYSNKEIITIVEEVTNSKVNLKIAPRRAGDANVLYASNEKLKRDLSWEHKYGIKEIIQSAYLWHKTNNKRYN